MVRRAFYGAFVGVSIAKCSPSRLFVVGEIDNIPSRQEHLHGVVRSPSPHPRIHGRKRRTISESSHLFDKGEIVFKNQKVQALLILAAGALLGYGAATGAFRFSRQAEATPADAPAFSPRQLAEQKEPAKNGKKPNILVIWGDDIGYWNISAYNRGMMGYRTPNIDRIAKEGAISSPTGTASNPAPPAGPPSSPAKVSDSAPASLKVGLPGAPEGLSEGSDPRRPAQAARAT